MIKPDSRGYRSLVFYFVFVAVLPGNARAQVDRTDIIFKPETILVYQYMGRLTGGAQHRYLGTDVAGVFYDYIFLLGTLRGGERFAVGVGIRKGNGTVSDPFGYEHRIVDSDWDARRLYVNFDGKKCATVADIKAEGRVAWYKIKGVFVYSEGWKYRTNAHFGILFYEEPDAFLKMLSEKYGITRFAFAYNIIGTRRNPRPDFDTDIVFKFIPPWNME